MPRLRQLVAWTLEVWAFELLSFGRQVEVVASFKRFAVPKLPGRRAVHDCEDQPTVPAL